jgi:hypothetical protein
VSYLLGMISMKCQDLPICQFVNQDDVERRGVESSFIRLFAINERVGLSIDLIGQFLLIQVRYGVTSNFEDSINQ